MRLILKLGFTLFIGMFLMACDQASRNDSGEIIASGNLDVFSLGVGDCTNDPQENIEGDEVESVDAVPCSDPHDNEFYAAFEVSYDEFPGHSVIEAAASEGCTSRFEGFTGIDYESSILEIYPMYPTEGSWDVGDREVICAVFHMEYEKLTGSVKGLGI